MIVKTEMHEDYFFLFVFATGFGGKFRTSDQVSGEMRWARELTVIKPGSSTSLRELFASIGAGLGDERWMSSLSFCI